MSKGEVFGGTLQYGQSFLSDLERIDSLSVNHCMPSNDDVKRWGHRRQSKKHYDETKLIKIWIGQ